MRKKQQIQIIQVHVEIQAGVHLTVHSSASQNCYLCDMHSVMPLALLSAITRDSSSV